MPPSKSSVVGVAVGERNQFNRDDDDDDMVAWTQGVHLSVQNSCHFSLPGDPLAPLSPGRSRK